jgi:hypothetical protein
MAVTIGSVSAALVGFTATEKSASQISYEGNWPLTFDSKLIPM